MDDRWIFRNVLRSTPENTLNPERAKNRALVSPALGSQRVSLQAFFGMTDKEAGNLQDHAGVFIPPPLLYVIVFLASLPLQLFWPVQMFPVEVGRAAAVVCIVLWVALSVWSIRTFWRAGTSIVPVKPSTSLVAHGPFRFTRNPMYVALALLYLGAAFLLNTPWPLLLFPILLILVQTYVIAREERYLERKFGDEYLQYKSRVRRWL